MRAGGELPPAFFLCPARVIARIPVIVYALNYPPEAPLAHNRPKRPSHGGEARARPCMPGGRLRRPWAVSAPLTAPRAPRPSPRASPPRRAAPVLYHARADTIHPPPDHHYRTPIHSHICDAGLEKYRFLWRGLQRGTPPRTRHAARRAPLSPI